MDNKEVRIMQTVDALGDDIVDLTQRLVKEPSTLGNEKSVLAVMEDCLRQLGLNPQKIPIDKEKLVSHQGFAPVPWDYENRYSLIATEPAAGKGRRLVVHGRIQKSNSSSMIVAKTSRSLSEMFFGLALSTYSVFPATRTGRRRRPYRLKGDVVGFNLTGIANSQ